MAEVHIERKEGATWWPWLLLALVVGGILWWMATANRGTDTRTSSTAASPAATTQTAADTNRPR